MQLALCLHSCRSHRAKFGLVILLASMAGWSQENPTPLTLGMHLERMLGPSDEHVYTAQMGVGSAIIGEADQQGVDLVIDIYGPDGKQITEVDSPNGTQGPEPINLTAIEAGIYQFRIHTLEKGVKPGKYVMKIDEILGPEENGKRLAKDRYKSQAIYDLWLASLADAKAVEKFVEGRKGKGPIIEEFPDDKQQLQVTYVYYGNEHTESVRTCGGPHCAVDGLPLTRFGDTPLFFASEVVPRDARYRYGFAAVETRAVGPAHAVQVSQELFTPDSLNPEVFGGLSVLTMPEALPQTYTVERADVPKGKTTASTFKSLTLKEDRDIAVYTPPGYDGKTGNNLLIVFDGGLYGAAPAQTFVPTQTILDNLIAEKKIGPTIAILVKNTNRTRDLGGYPPFVEFIGTELVNWARKNYNISPGPSHVAAAGSSRGGVAASYCALKHSESIGNVLSQSGAYWITNITDVGEQWFYPYAEEKTGYVIDEFRNSPRAPIKFYIEIGRFDNAAFMLPSNRELRDVLLTKGYDVTYHEFNSGHDYIWWRGSLADGLVALFGRP
jgi:enterochelin esterase-like enzyme